MVFFIVCVVIVIKFNVEISKVMLMFNIDVFNYFFWCDFLFLCIKYNWCVVSIICVNVVGFMILLFLEMCLNISLDVF